MKIKNRKNHRTVMDRHFSLRLGIIGLAHEPFWLVGALARCGMVVARLLVAWR
jgi:hypothetical protein